VARAGLARRRVVAHGRVQGVFFRASVRQLAEERGISGWARNRPDGTLEACLEGPSEGVEQLVAWCADGPEGARVTRLEVIEEEPQGIRGFDPG
jgi:acylphosphatase